MNRLRTALASAGALAVALAAALSAAPGLRDPDDLVFEGGRVVDGTGAPAFRADVAVSNGRIRAVGPLPEAEKTGARRRVDASGLVVAPGFVDLLGQSEYNVLVDGRAYSKVTQGITTEVTGEGTTLYPQDGRMIEEGKDVWALHGLRPDWTTLGGYVARFRRSPPAINLATFVGLGSVREVVMGKSTAHATAAELAAMERLVTAAMDEGALGVSVSLQYTPDLYLTTEEIVALARVAARAGGVLFAHQRSEADRIDASMDEVFRIARETPIPVDVWHLKTAGRRNWGKLPAVLARLEAARAEGLDVAASQYPWTASSNGLSACLPPWAREGTTDAIVARLRDPAARARIREELVREDAGWENQYLGAGGPSGILVASVLSPALKRVEGKTLAALAAEEGKDPRDTLLDLLVADRAGSSGIYTVMSEADVRAALAHRLVAFCTDSGAAAPDGPFGKERTHPRGWGSAPRILGTYVREEKLLPLEEAVRKMTSLPAARARLARRGLLVPGMAADVTVFDPARVRCLSTYDRPTQTSEGVPYVAVNGVLVVDGGKVTAARPGSFLAGPAAGRSGR